VLTGSEKAFAAGADIKEMQAQGFADMFAANFFAGWERVTDTRKPWIAAVNGFALGGGCEVAMMADFIIAGDKAKFGQPEIKLGVTPGMGGSQRLAAAVGKAKAMEMCLTGRMMGAEEAERAGLVARVVPAETLIDEALRTAAEIAAMPTARCPCRQGNGQRRLRASAGAGLCGSSGGLFTACSDRGPEGRHGGVRGEAAGR
jgi:enoyl-CoA hydratase